MRYRCENCETSWDRDECADAVDVAERHDPGGPFTDKECPDCGALVYRLPAMKFRWRKQGEHTHVVVFMGEDVEHLANCGVLALRNAEWKRFVDTLKMGTDTNKCELHFEEKQDG